ncbi:MAG: DUF971 domain-containing protein [Lacipirellulaceae bacterium]
MVIPNPTQIERLDDQRLRISWSDGTRRVYRTGELRDRCPCATCREKRSAPAPAKLRLTVLSAAEAQPLRVAGMRPVGSYAYHIDFSDGHNTGIYTFELLRELGADESVASA